MAQIEGGHVDDRVGAVPGPDSVNRHVTGPGTGPGSVPGLVCLKWAMCKRGYSYVCRRGLYVVYIVTQTPSFRRSRDLDKSNKFRPMQELTNDYYSEIKLHNIFRIAYRPLTLVLIKKNQQLHSRSQYRNDNEAAPAIGGFVHKANVLCFVSLFSQKCVWGIHFTPYLADVYVWGIRYIHVYRECLIIFSEAFHLRWINFTKSFYLRWHPFV